MVEEYCWAITQVAGRPCCGKSGSGVLELVFQLGSLVCTYMVEHRHTQFRLAQKKRLAPDLPERTVTGP